ncbi:MAG: SCP2 sterol-binding domain-containing protein [Myxococcales bacterium]|nr:SCP2 sterol-binding domain-containing protein [Myxococcales bacterium]
MITLFDLPDDTTPIQFFDTILPSELSRIPVPPHASPQRCLVHVHGENGGSWSIGVDGQTVTIRSGHITGAVLHLSITEDDWRELMFGSVRDRAVDILGGRAKAEALYNPSIFGKLFLSQDQFSRLRQFAGDLQLEIDDREELNKYLLTITIGGDKPNLTNPRAKLTILLNDWLGSLTGQTNLQQAFMQGRIQLAGDMGLPMGLLSVFMSP